MSTTPPPRLPVRGSITPYIIVKGAGAAIAFYTKVFAPGESRLSDPDGRIGHAESSSAMGV